MLVKNASTACDLEAVQRFGIQLPRARPEKPSKSLRSRAKRSTAMPCSAARLRADLVAGIHQPLNAEFLRDHIQGRLCFGSHILLHWYSFTKNTDDPLLLTIERQSIPISPNRNLEVKPIGFNLSENGTI